MFLKQVVFCAKKAVDDRQKDQLKIQGVVESCTDILITSYWLHVELGKKNSMSKNKMTFFELQFFNIAFSLLRCQTTS
jgi:hypothetical protein